LKPGSRVHAHIPQSTFSALKKSGSIEAPDTVFVRVVVSGQFSALKKSGSIEAQESVLPMHASRLYFPL